MAGLISILFLAVLSSCHIGFGKWKLLYWISKMLIYRKFGGINDLFVCLFRTSDTQRAFVFQDHDGARNRVTSCRVWKGAKMGQVWIFFRWFRYLSTDSFLEMFGPIIYRNWLTSLPANSWFRSMDLAEVPPGWSCGWLILVISMLWSRRISGEAERGGRERATNWGHLLLQNHMQCENAHSKDQQLGASSFFPVTWTLPEVPGKIQSDESSNVLVFKTKPIAELAVHDFRCLSLWGQQRKRPTSWWAAV